MAEYPNYGANKFPPPPYGPGQPLLPLMPGFPPYRRPDKFPRLTLLTRFFVWMSVIVIVVGCILAIFAGVEAGG